MFGDVAHSVLGGAWWQDVLYFLFVPVTIIKVKFQNMAATNVEKAFRSLFVVKIST